MKDKENIVEILRKNRERKEAASERYSKVLNENRKNLEGTVKSILNGKPQENGLSIGATRLRQLFYQYLTNHSGRTHAFDKGLTKASRALWERVEARWVEADVAPERFIEAQFSYFDKTFGKAPSLVQLTTPTAVERAQEHTGKVKGKIVGTGKPVDVSKADVFRQTERTLQQMMAAQSCSRVEFYQRFVLTGLFAMPRLFMEADPAYHQALKDQA